MKVDLRTALRSSCVVVCVTLASCGGGAAQAAPSPSTGEPGPVVLPGAPPGNDAAADPIVVAEAPKEEAPKKKDDKPKDEQKSDGDVVQTSSSLELVHTVKTSKSRDAMSASLVKPAKAAFDKREFERAIRFYNALVVARGPASDEALKLAEAWALASQPLESLEVLEDFILASTDADKVKQAKKDATNLRKIADKATRQKELPSLDKDAKKLFDAGRKAFKKKQYADALVYFHMGLALAPDLPGFLRELGQTYDKLGAKDKKLSFYLDYLHARPFGKNADAIRKEVPKDQLASLTVASSLPCDFVLINRQLLPAKKLPAKDLKLAAGLYKGMCFNAKYEIIVFDRVEVKTGGKHELTFNWAIVVNDLQNPMGRIAIEDAYEPGVMMDLGITSPELGVVLPDDGRALKVIIKADDGSKTEERFLKFTAGEKKVIKW